MAQKKYRVTLEAGQLRSRGNPVLRTFEYTASSPASALRQVLKRANLRYQAGSGFERHLARVWIEVAP